MKYKLIYIPLIIAGILFCYWTYEVYSLSYSGVKLTVKQENQLSINMALWIFLIFYLAIAHNIFGKFYKFLIKERQIKLK